MDFMIFEGTSEEERHPSVGLDLCGDLDLAAISAGDIVWIVTRTGADRATPALCGRLVARRVRPHSPGHGPYKPEHADCAHILMVDEASSERCEPVSCPMIVSWDLWRQPFAGVRPLTDEQGAALGAEWARSPRGAGAEWSVARRAGAAGS